MKPTDIIEVKLKNYSLFVDDELESSQLEIVQKEIGESDESRERCLQLLKKSLSECKDNLHPCMEDDFLLWFLRVSKFNPKKALERIQKYYKSQERYLNVFKKHPMTLKEANMYHYVTASPYRMENNSIVVISKPAFFNYSIVPFEPKIYLDLIVANKVLSNPVTQMCGGNLIIDVGGASLQTLRAHNLGGVRLLIDILLMVQPVRAQSLHIVNTTAIFPLGYTMIYPFLPKKIKERAFIHPNNDNWKSLHSYFPREILPEAYGGDLKESSMIDLMENVEDLEISFRERLKYGFKTTEALRSTWTGIKLKN